MKLVYTVLVLAALVYVERCLIEPRLTGARLSALVQAALVYKVLVYLEWIPAIQTNSPPHMYPSAREAMAKKSNILCVCACLCVRCAVCGVQGVCILY